ncbi:hypothetical protein M0C34_04135 [Agarivorans sp. TSD2052]|uniref:hypothetical protein n=1 Tax=Agarivorans sp. TSD2052 TaxID=2937286 RepID=UPI00200BAA44|nr:hypothetical protein [Agarivorans sp. TSD2052]UPW19477.1 hypothetical protein M0C34_04135 [Agarivorans sp. TSD2052]
MRNISISALLLCAVISPLQAEEQSVTEQQHYLWLEPGLSFGRPGMSIALDLYYSYSDYSISLGVLGGNDDGCQLICEYEDGKDNYSSTRLMVGKYFYPGEYEFLVETGIAKLSVATDHFDGETWQTFESDSYGIPIRFSKYFNLKYIGFAVTGEALVTTDDWLASFGFRVPFGKLRHW